ncbi:hypothetical protein K490DRAFT_63953 [Saccharata proteae CBS 121410]|uniref:Uncharacterized protein n=1 Tax=Saccharata proteae CBS 121410 TaxID=1314787 RepID=A0A6A5YAT3_9PEZI|nr:hypothetical protein K490DRAFT_63953 [Saccharata proteae CBS 121410]
MYSFPCTHLIHFCESISAAKNELPALLSSNPVANPAHPIGSNASRAPTAHRLPQVILVGAGFPDHDYEDLRQTVSKALGEAVGEKVQGALWVRERKEDIKGLEREENWVVVDGKGRFPRPEVIAEGMRGVLDRSLG